VVIFGSRRNKTDMSFKIGDFQLEIVDEYVYLGVSIMFNGNLTPWIVKICDQASRAMYALTRPDGHMFPAYHSIGFGNNVLYCRPVAMVIWAVARVIWPVDPLLGAFGPLLGSFGPLLGSFGMLLGSFGPLLGSFGHC
jgi:hypothetical protein